MLSVVGYPWEQETLPQTHQLITQNGWAHAHEQHRALEAADFRDWPLPHATALTFGTVIQDRLQGPDVKVQPLSKKSNLLATPLCISAHPTSLPRVTPPSPQDSVPLRCPGASPAPVRLLGSIPSRGLGIRGSISVLTKPPYNIWCVFSIFLMNEGMKRWQARAQYLETCFWIFTICIKSALKLGWCWNEVFELH